MTFSPMGIAQLAACLALVLCLYALVQALASVRLRSPARLVSARHAMLAVFALLTLAGALLIRAFVISDFGVAYVAQNANLELPMLYKVAATWGAHEGSLLLWSWYLALMTAVALVIHWRDHPLSMPWIVATLATVQIGFLALIVFLSNPFATLLPVPDNGRDLNPLLQDPGLAFHPPVLYLGYVGFAVPFAFGMAALIRRHVGIEWVTAVRRWVLFAWTMLTTGIIFGGYWAYYELGWGGYWAWDPVENASLMPWLTGTALLHSMMAQEKRQMFRLWNMFLVISTFLLTLLGTFLVRSGVLTSVHSFASDPARGTYILIFLGGAMLAGYGLLIWRAETLESDAAVESPFSREAGLLANNVLLLIAAATVVIGTLFPLAVEVITGDKISVGAPYFNAVILPIMVGLMFLMALGPSVPWRRMDPARFARQFGWPLAFGGAAVAVALWAGVVRPLSLAAILAVGFAALATLEDLRRAIAVRMRVTDEWAPRAALSVVLLGRRRIGGLVVHLGIVILAAGMIGSGLFQEARTVHLRVGQSTEIAGHVLTLREVSNISGPNWTGRAARLSVARDGVPMAEMVPEKRFYTIRAMATTETAIESRWAGDLYVFMGDELDGGLVMQVYWNPLVRLVWLGWLVIFLGAGLSLTQPRLAAAPRARGVPNEGVPAE